MPSNGDMGRGQLNGMFGGGERHEQEQVKQRCLTPGSLRRMCCSGEEYSSTKNVPVPSASICQHILGSARRPPGLVKGHQEGRLAQSARVLCVIHSWVFFCRCEGQSTVDSIRKTTQYQVLCGVLSESQATPNSTYLQAKISAPMISTLSIISNDFL